MQPGGLVAAGLLLLAGCTSGGGARPEAVGQRAPMTGDVGRVLGHSAAQLTELFGVPDQDVRAMAARRLQFASSACVLDAYLYPKAGAREPVVTWIDTRAAAGTDIDRASCIAALTRRKAAR